MIIIALENPAYPVPLTIIIDAVLRQLATQIHDIRS